MMECKNALKEAEGNEEKAIDILRARGLARAATFTWARTAEATVQAYRAAIGAGAAA